MTVHELVKGGEYEVVRDFRDYYNNEFRAGERLAFTQTHFLPYHGGYTVVFGPVSMYLQEEVNAAIVDHIDEYLRAC